VVVPEVGEAPHPVRDGGVAVGEDLQVTEIVRLYSLLEVIQPSPVVSLNRAVAVATADGLERGLALVNALAAGGELDSYHLLHATRADLL
jgi:RNA polymerase sigma-70 factor (ECF subfamily)